MSAKINQTHIKQNKYLTSIGFYLPALQLVPVDDLDSNVSVLN